MEIPRHWRLKKQRYALIGEVCPSCKARIFPPKEVCPECGGRVHRGVVDVKGDGGVVFVNSDIKQGE